MTPAEQRAVLVTGASSGIGLTITAYLAERGFNRAFFPLLKESKGRTAIIGSLSAFVVSPTGGAYGMSKAAAEMYTDTLAAELASEGVKAGIIDPGGFQSRAREKVVMRMLTGSPDLDQELNDEQQKVYVGVQEAEAKLGDPTPVAEQVFDFLTSEAPRVHYMAAHNEDTAHFIVRNVLNLALELNASQAEYTLKRDDLVKTLDELLVTQPANTH